MIQEKIQPSQSETSGQFEVVRANIKSENMHRIFRSVTSSLYSDKMLAPIREYLTNAYDEHDKYEVRRPVEVSLPNQFDSYFRVRDFAKGLSKEKFADIYLSYGESDKRNNNLQIGCLGYGSKSAHAYTAEFGGAWQVDTVYEENGKRRKCSYLMSMTETDAPEPVGELIFEGDTEEETGIRISIPIQKNDRTIFNEKFFSFLADFGRKPYITGLDSLPLFERKVVLSGENWKITDAGFTPSVNMGGIRYKVDVYALNWSRKNMEFFNALNGLIFYCGLGEVSFTDSRENLEYTTKTKKFLINAVARFKKEFANTVQKEIEKCGSYWEACWKFRDIINVFNFSTKIQDTVMRKVRYEGKSLRSEIRVPNEDWVNNVIFNVFGYTGDSIENLGTQSKTIFYRDTKIMYSEGLTARGCYSRLRTYYASNKWDRVYVLIGNRENLKSFCEYNNINIDEIESIKNYKPTRASNNNRSGVNRSNAKVFVYNHNYSSPTRSRDHWEPFANNFEDGGVYVSLDRFSVEQLNWSKKVSFLNKIQKNFKIFGIRSGDVEKLGNNWQSLDKCYENALNSYKKKYDFTAIEKWKGFDRRSYRLEFADSVAHYISRYGDKKSSLTQYAKMQIRLKNAAQKIPHLEIFKDLVSSCGSTSSKAGELESKAKREIPIIQMFDRYDKIKLIEVAENLVQLTKNS